MQEHANVVLICVMVNSYDVYLQILANQGTKMRALYTNSPAIIARVFFIDVLCVLALVLFEFREARPWFRLGEIMEES